jgi:predicted nucleotidyltransferase
MDSTRQILNRLDKCGVDYVVIGGLAAVLHGSVIATNDVDICIFAVDESFQKIVAAFADVHPRYRMRPDHPRVTPEHPWLKLGLKNFYLLTDIGQLDILGEVPGIGDFNFIRDKTIEVDLGTMKCRILDIPTLISAKQQANRPKDRQSIAELTVILKRLDELRDK